MGMKVLVVGGGGREHALVWKIAQSPLVEQVYCAPGNAGIAEIAECPAIADTDIDGLAAFALEKQVDLTMVGPEASLVLGIVNKFQSLDLTIFGPTQAAAEMEGSKTFMKMILKKYGIATAAYEAFTDPEAAKVYIREQGAPIVVKASGLAAGKGVLLCKTLDEAFAAVDQTMVDKAFGDAGNEIVVEEFLEGEEASFIALVDGKNILPLAGSQDHKAVGEGDTGLNTGGMGAYSPAPVLTEEMYQKAMDEVMRPTVDGMAAEGRPYVGVLYAGLMIKEGAIKVLEFNCRFGDPETQPILMRMKSDLVPLLLAGAQGELAGRTIDWDERTALCVVMASGGYPEAYDKGHVIDGLDEAAAIDDLVVFHAGTSFVGDTVVTHGGRVLGVTALGATVAEAQAKALEGVEKINWKDANHRRDIGYRAIAREQGK